MQCPALVLNGLHIPSIDATSQKLQSFATPVEPIVGNLLVFLSI